MSKFNLKTYKKISGDQHIDSRLKENHEKAPEVINEKQLEDYRACEPTVLVEKQLEESRESTKTTEATEITEKQLDAEKGKFNIKLRNASAYEGDLPKLEEQRLRGDPIEDEKYDNASQTPKQMRWWEDAPKSPDGLKLAQKKSVIQTTAQYSELSLEKPGFKDSLEGDDPDIDFAFDINDETIDNEDALLEDDEAAFLGEDFKERDYNVVDAGGTPMAHGVIDINIDVTATNEERIINDVIDYIQNRHNIIIDREALDLSNLRNGEVEFLKELPIEMSLSASVNFPIIEVTAQDVKKK